MARKRKKSAPRRAPRPRRMNGARRSRSRRRMNAVKKADALGVVADVAKVTGGVVLGMIGIGMAKDLIGNYYGRAAAVGAVGLAAAVLVKDDTVRKVGIGIAVGAATGATMKALSGTRIVEAMNGVKRLSPSQMKALADGLKKQGRIGRQPGTLTGQPDTMNRAMAPTLNGGWEQINASWQ